MTGSLLTGSLVYNHSCTAAAIASFASGDNEEAKPTIISKLATDSAWEDEEFRVAAMSLLVKCADMNSAGRPPAVAGMWARAIYREFFRQADLEKDMGLPPTPVFQRNSAIIWAAQVLSTAPRTSISWGKCTRVMKRIPTELTVLVAFSTTP